MPEMITANRLYDGHVVYLDAQDGWTEDFRRGLVLEGPEAGEAALARGEAAAKANLVVDPYAIELEMRVGHLAPKTLRERIRAEGPTVGGSIARG